MSNDLSSAVSSAFIYSNMSLPVFLLTTRDNKPVKHFKWNSFQHTLPAQEQMNSLFRGTEVNIDIATEASSLIHRHNIAPQLPRREKGEWP